MANKMAALTAFRSGYHLSYIILFLRGMEDMREGVVPQVVPSYHELRLIVTSQNRSCLKA